MKRFFTAAASLSLAALCAAPAFAQLEQGATAPQFAADGFLAGQPFSFDLKDALKNGPVVLYFFPAAFTPGCNLEASLFADAADDFEAAGATLIGATAGNTDQLSEFSEKHCANKFPVVSASDDVIAAYDVALEQREGWTDRTSYVIAPDGSITLSYSDLQPTDHIQKTLDAVKAMSAGE